MKAKINKKTITKNHKKEPFIDIGNALIVKEMIVN